MSLKKPSSRSCSRRAKPGKSQSYPKASVPISTHPVFAEWDHEANQRAGLYSGHVTKASQVSCHWVCATCGHKWKAPPHSRTRRSRASGCPECARVARIKHIPTGTRFGSWVVLGRDDSKKGRVGMVYWLVRCDCGHQSSIPGAHLRGGQSTRCQTCASNSQRVPQQINGRYWRSLRYSARDRSLDFSLTKTEIFQLLQTQQGRCALSGAPIQLAPTCAEHQQGETSASLDRIDSSKGYVPGNVQWVHMDINHMKGTLSDEVFIKWCQAVAEHCR